MADEEVMARSGTWGDRSPARDPRLVGAATVLLAAGVLYLDIVTPHGYGAGFFFIVPFLIALFGLPRLRPLLAAAVFVLLSAVGFVASPPGIPLTIALIDRLALWVLFAGIAAFVDRYRRESRERRALDERYRALFWRHYIPILIVDPADGRIVDANPAAARFYGYPRTALVAMRITDLNDLPESEVRARLREAVEGQQAPFHFVHCLASGERRNVEVFSGPIEVGGLLLLFSIIFDVTEATRTAAALAASEARFRSLFDELQEAVVLYEVVPGPDGQPADLCVIDLNPANERMFGRSRDETIGRTLRELYPGRDPPRLEDFIRVARTGEPVVIPSFERGGDRRFEARLYRPRPDQVAGLFIDVTERLRAEEALRASNEDLERFAYVASHDLREPLRSIVSFSDLLARRYRGRLDVDADEFIGYIVEGGRRMERLIEDLLRLSRVGSGPLALAPVDAEEALGAVERSLAGLVARTGAVVTHDPLPVVLAERSGLEQVLANLVANGIKFHGEAPARVHVAAVREGPLWRFSVTDNGIGIPEADREAVFEPFRRLPTAHEIDGTGIGLAVVRRIVERHGGRVRVESEPGRGSTFFFTLPAADQAV